MRWTYLSNRIFATSACVFNRKTTLSSVHRSYSFIPMHTLALLYFAELSFLCRSRKESVNVFFLPRFDFRTSDIFINKQFRTCANALPNEFTVRSYEYWAGQHWILSWMEENQTATYFLRSSLFTYDSMKNFNCNYISLWFIKSKFRSYIGKHFFIIKITACMPLRISHTDQVRISLCGLLCIFRFLLWRQTYILCSYFSQAGHSFHSFFSYNFGN